MGKKPPLTLVEADASGVHPPRPLGVVGQDLWGRVQVAYQIDDAGGIELLAQACHAADRAEALRVALDRDGELIKTRSGLKEHPALRLELANRQFVVRTLTRLGLSVEPIKNIGRPGYGIGWSGK